jgi:hypothetical protein
MVGCASSERQVSYVGFEQIRTQQTSRAEVVELFGEPDQKMGDGWWMYRRPEEHIHVIIEFDDSTAPAG